MREEITKGRAIIALLDAMIAPVLEATPSLLTEWRTLKKQVRPGTSASVTEPAPTPIAPATDTSRDGNVPSTPEVKAA